MRIKAKKFLAYLLTITMVILLMPATIAKATEISTETSTLRIMKGDTDNATISYKLGEADFVEVDPGSADPGGNIRISIADGTAVIVRVFPKQEVKIKGINVREGEEDNAGMAFNGVASTSEGFFQYEFPARVTGEGGIAYSLKVEYGDSNESQQPENPIQGNEGKLRFKCQSNAVNGGDIYYKLDDAREFTRLTITNNAYDMIDVSTASTITIKFVHAEGFRFDTTRGGILNGQMLDSAGLTSSDGLTIELGNYVRGECTIAQSEYELEFGFENANGGQPGQQEGPRAWNQQYDGFITDGLNIASMWVGNSAGDISYEFSNDDNLNLWSSKTTITRSEMEAWLYTITSEDASGDDKSAAMEKLFGLNVSGKYIRILAGADAGGDKLGFDIYSKDSDNNYHFDEEKTRNIKFYDYSTREWKSFDNENYKWEEYLKGRGFYDPETNTSYYEDEGLIIDLSAVNKESGDGFYCHIPFDSRKNISWWNEKYKGEVAAAGDHPGEDSWVENGMVELVSVVSEDGTEVYYSDEENWEPDSNVDESLVVELGKAGYDHGMLRAGYSVANDMYTEQEMLEAADKASGQCNVPNGSIVTVKLIPDPGYQILKAEINGMALRPDAGTESLFSFKINSNIHFLALFEETKDVVDVSDSDVVSGAVIDGANAVVEAGNVALIVDDDNNYDTSEALKQVDGTAVASVDIAVEQIVAKAGNLSQEEQQAAREGTLAVTDDNYWTTPMAELKQDIDISLTLENVTVEEGETLSLVRDHDGECKEIPVEVTMDNGKLVASFESSKFSVYTFVKSGEAKHTHTLKTTTTKATSSKNGKVETKCTVCGEVTKTTTIYYPKTFTLSNTSFEYDSKAHKPTVTVKDYKGNTISASYYTVAYLDSAGKSVSPTSVGTYTVKITMKDKYNVTTSKTFNINPKTTTIGTPAIAADGITVKWSKNTSGKGYIIYRSTNGSAYEKVKTISDNTVVSWKDTAAKTNGAKYQYKIVTYKVVDGVNYKSGYSSVKTRYFVSQPAISSLVNGAAGKMTVKWGKNSKATGYQIQYSTDSSFATYKTSNVTSNATVARTFSSLKKGSKYYVRIRSYKTVGDTKYYSAWSSKKSVSITK